MSNAEKVKKLFYLNLHIQIHSSILFFFHEYLRLSTPCSLSLPSQIFDFNPTSLCYDYEAVNSQLSTSLHFHNYQSGKSTSR